MSQMRHATRIHNSQRNIYWAKALQLFSKFTRLQIILLSVAACSIVLGVTSSLNQPANTATQTALAANDKRVSFSIDLQTNAHATPSVSEQTRESTNETPQTLTTLTSFSANPSKNLAVILPPQETIKNRTIQSGDNLSSVFQSVGLGAKEVYRITQSGKEGKALTRMYPGESLAFVFNNDDKLQRIIRNKSALESIHFTPNNDTYLTEQKLRTPQIKHVHRSAMVTHSLALSANRSGISDTTTMNMANIFGGVIDFVYDVRSGDKFTVIYEELYLDDKKIDEGNIIAAQYVNRDKTYNAFRYEHETGEIGYYNEEGVSMRKAFLRAPLDFTRVSSSFNLKRLHPITKKVKPHRGIDYAAPTGTAIFSVGEGRVIASSYSKANGKYVFIKHGEAYTTKYLHLSRRNVKRGQRVKQGQIIGQVGCTGMCTGPHLHYEFLVNGVHRNPRTIVSKLPKAKRLAKSELPAFTVATAESQDVLQHFSAQFELAANTLPSNE